FGPTSPFWVSDNGADVATIYNGAGVKQGLTVSVPSAPTGQVFNTTANSFQINGVKPAFLFDTENGGILGWAPSFGTTAEAAPAGSPDSVYKGLAIGSAGGNDYLYATNFRDGVVELYKNNFSSLTTFTDPTVATGYAPFGAQVLNGKLYVTFALQDGAKHDDVGAPGNGYVDVFNLDGTFDHRIVSQGGPINSPWGLAIAPASFGNLAGDLLVGNFGDGTISAFNLNTDAFDGKLVGRDGQPLVFGDLWALTPGNGAAAGSTQKIYFTAGVSEESEGLFGSLTSVPEPSAWTLMILGFGLTGAAIRARGRIAQSG
ncbi:MAG TPA: TIGR03118 family protein, partial [Phenylobacterium sp.]|nr:TIGR03118 family protein [Phenylobacterium sp.]